METMETTVIKFSEIDANPSLNSRKHYEKVALDALKTDIAENGLISPLVVADRANAKGKFRLVAGFRRYLALKALKAKEVEVKVLVGNAVDCALLNIRENMAREDLTTYELALACQGLRDTHKMSGEKISKALCGFKGAGKSYINRLLKCLDKAPDYVLHAWADPTNARHRLCTVEKMEKVIAEAKTDEQMGRDQWEKYAGEMKADRAPRQTGQSNPDDPPPVKPRKLKAEDFTQAMVNIKTACRESEITAEETEGAVGVLKWVTGLVKTLRIDGVLIYDPAAAEKAAEKTKENEKKTAAEKKAQEKKAKKAERLKAELAELGA